ncbi:MAG: LysM peptidoglycan-binding domain-containing protein [Bacilli bacterium]|nr:LysM peptidoglycan-binding domain-containing protein [Bacilli bacterium]
MNYKIVVDPGHGGVDPGAVSGDLQEKDFTLKASKYMYDRFNQLGIPVKLTRDTDETLPKTERIERILNAFGNSNDVILISNHINAGGGDGAEVVYALRNKDTLAKNVLNNIAKEGQNVRNYYQRRLPSDPSKDYYFIHRETGKLEPILVEYGFIDSNKDDVVQLKNNIDNYAEAVVKAVANYIGVPYTLPGQKANTYVVKKGDSLYSIANSFGVSLEALKNANGISGNLINIGQVLTIPTASNKTPGDYVVYTVKKGDSLWSIANTYNVSVNDIVDYNNLGTTMLQIGQQLLIPNESKFSSDDKNGITYIVKSGDSLWSIAKKYNVSVDSLKSINNLNSNLLSIGQELVIPQTEEYKTYIVKSGDSLWKIARDNDVNVNDLIALNNLNSTVLQIGQQLLIP